MVCWQQRFCYSSAFVGGTENGFGGTALLSITNGGLVRVQNNVAQPAVTVAPSGTLTGNGTVDTTNSETPTTNVQGTLEPSGGRLTISSGNLSFSGSAPLMVSKVTPTSQDNVYVSPGAATLTGKLKVSMSGTFTPGTTYTLLYAHGDLGNTKFQSYSISLTNGSRLHTRHHL